MKYSAVSSMYGSAPYLGELFSRLAASFAPLAGDDWEIVLVNDGSPDDSLAVAQALRARDSRVKIIDFARNFGHHKALLTGLRYASGERVFLIDADLEEAPELVADFARELDADSELDVVYGVQAERKGGWFEQISGRVFYRAMSALSEVPYPADTFTARLMTRRYVEALKLFNENEYDLWVDFALAGFRQKPYPATKRDKGSSTYTLGRKMRHAVESVASSSVVPLYGIFLLGGAIFALAVLALVLLFVNKFCLGGEIPLGWSSLAASLWGLGGMMMISVGVVGIYLGKVFREVKRRPSVIVRATYGFDWEKL